MFLFQEKSRWFREKPFFCPERCVIFGIKKKSRTLQMVSQNPVLARM